MNIYLFIGLLVFFHLIDMLFTVLYLKKAQKHYFNPEELEINYHKWFFKKFGLNMGALLSSVVSVSVIILIAVILYTQSNVDKLFICGWIVGMQFMVAYSNYMNYMHYDEVRKKVKRKKKWECMMM